MGERALEVQEVQDVVGAPPPPSAGLLGAVGRGPRTSPRTGLCVESKQPTTLYGWEWGRMQGQGQGSFPLPEVALAPWR